MPNLPISVFPRLFGVITLLGVSQARGVQTVINNLQKKANKSCRYRKAFTKKSKKSDVEFASVVFYRVFGRFSARGVRKNKTTEAKMGGGGGMAKMSTWHRAWPKSTPR
jgi:hypothetical protein